MKNLTLFFFALIISSHTFSQTVDEKGVFHFGEWENKWGYAQGRKVGNSLYISGTVAGGETMEEQVKGIFDRISKTLEAYGLDATHIVKEMVYTTDIEAMKKANKPRMEFYNGNTPAATWVQIDRLFTPDKKVEIEVEARFDIQ